MAKDAWPYVQYGTPPTVADAGGQFKVVLFSGFRHWDDVTAIEDVLNFLELDVLIHGAAAGADFIADQWATRAGGVTIEPHKIPSGWWETYGKGAGPLRNDYMVSRAKLYEGKGHRVLTLAFPAPESTGTIDLIEKAVEANLPVLRYQ